MLRGGRESPDCQKSSKKETKETRQEKRGKCQRNESRVIEMRSMSLLKKMRDGEKTKHSKTAAAEVTREICFQKKEKGKWRRVCWDLADGDLKAVLLTPGECYSCPG